MTRDQIPVLVDHLFRRQAGRLVALVAGALGPAHLDLAEEVVQEALVAALQTWPHRGIPDQPIGWLHQVARNRAIDALRRRRVTSADAAALERELTRRVVSDAHDASAPPLDDELAMMFMTSHPDLPRESRIALTLKIACGLSVPEIARALLSDDRAVAQRIVRAKRQIRARHLALALPGREELATRLDSLLEVIYLLFNEGYAASEGETHIREDLCFEAIRLVQLLRDHPATARPESHALAALLLFLAARLPARVDHAGEISLLQEQDRRQWNTGLIHAGFRALDQATAGERMTHYHIQAAIAAAHASAPTFAATDWTRIAGLYDDLIAVSPTAIVALNRAIAVGYRDGPVAGLAALSPLRKEPALRRYHLLYSARASFLAAAGRVADARRAYRQALGCRLTAAERKFLEKRAYNPPRGAHARSHRARGGAPLLVPRPPT